MLNFHVNHPGILLDAHEHSQLISIETKLDALGIPLPDFNRVNLNRVQVLCAWSDYINRILPLSELGNLRAARKVSGELF